MNKFNLQSLNLNNRLIAQILFYSTVAIAIIGFLMFLNGFNRFSISGIRKDTGRVEFEFYDNYMYMFSHNNQVYAPVTDIRYYKSDSKDKPSNPLIVFFTTTDKFKFYAETNDISEEDLIELHKELQVFMDDENLKEFGDSFFYLKFYGIIGLFMMVLAGYFVIPLFKRIPKLTSEEKLEFKAKILSKLKDLKKIKDIKVKNKQSKNLVQEVVSGDRHLKILIPAYDKNIKFNPAIFKTPYTHSIALVCTSAQKKEFQELYNNEFEYIVSDNIKSTSEMVILAEKWMKDFAGYLIVQTENLTNITSSTVIDLYKEHKSAQNECTILVTDTIEKNIPIGKIMRNMANRIIKISETNENNDNQGQAGEVFLGLFCFNSKKIFETLRSLSHSGQFSTIPLTRIVEKYHTNRSKINVFLVKNAKKQISKSGNTSQNRSVPTQDMVCLIVATTEFDENKIKSSFDALSPEIEKIYVIINKSDQPAAEELLGESVEFVFAEGKIGDADDVLKANEQLRGFNGYVIVIPESSVVISKEMVNRLIAEHSDHNNICTYATSEGNNILYCTDAFQFLYAVKMIGRNDETRKYHLSDLVDILVNANKRVQEVEM